MASTHRVNRVRGMLTRELSDIIMRLKDPRIHLVTVVDTELSKDLRYAKVFVSVIGSAEEQQEAMKGLENALGYIRREVAKRVQLRIVPEIRVVYDQTIERTARLTALIDSLSHDDNA